MAIDTNTADNERKKFVESTTNAGQPGVAVVNPDGSSILGSSVATTGLTTTYANNSLSTTVSTVKNSAVKIYDIHIANPNAGMAYVQFFDTTGAITLGTTPPWFVLAVPSNGVLDRPMNVPYNFTNNCKMAATTTATGNAALTNPLVATIGGR